MNKTAKFITALSVILTFIIVCILLIITDNKTNTKPFKRKSRNVNKEVVKENVDKIQCKTMKKGPVSVYMDHNNNELKQYLDDIKFRSVESPWNEMHDRLREFVPRPHILSGTAWLHTLLRLETSIKQEYIQNVEYVIKGDINLEMLYRTKINMICKYDDNFRPLFLPLIQICSAIDSLDKDVRIRLLRNIVLCRVETEAADFVLRLLCLACLMNRRIYKDAMYLTVSYYYGFFNGWNTTPLNISKVCNIMIQDIYRRLKILADYKSKIEEGLSACI